MTFRPFSTAVMGLVVLGLAISSATAQVTLQVGAGGGLRMPMGDYKGETTEYYAGTKYGLATGYTIQAKGRVGLPGFTLVGGIEYGHLSNSGASEGAQGKVEVTQSIMTFKAGPEFTIPLPAAPLSPYIGANVAYHTISGTTTFTGVSRVPSGSFDMTSASRIGFGFNGGVLIKLGPAMKLDVGAEYALINPLTKEWKSPVSNNRIDSYKELNDEKDPLYAAGNTDHFVAGARSIATLSITATLMLGL